MKDQDVTATPLEEFNPGWEPVKLGRACVICGGDSQTGWSRDAGRARYCHPCQNKLIEEIKVQNKLARLRAVQICRHRALSGKPCALPNPTPPSPIEGSEKGHEGT